jgi:hypothetical protein
MKYRENNLTVKSVSISAIDMKAIAFKLAGYTR